MFEQFKPLMTNGERYVVVEGGKPEYVLLRFKDYVDLVQVQKHETRASLVSERSGLWERANAELAEVRRDGTLAHLETDLAGDPIPPPIDPTAVRLEDLPL